MTDDISFGSQPLVGRDPEHERVVRSLDAGRSVVLVGAAGVGKSRVAEAGRDAAVERGMLVLSASATAASSRLTLGALAHLLPPATDLSRVHEDLQPTHLLQATSESLRDRAGDRRLLVFVDDAHHLDPVAAHLLHQLATSGVAQLLMTIRTGSGAPDRPADVWNDPRVDLVDVETLGRAAVTAFAGALLGGPLEEATAAWLFEVSGANALFLRELVLGGVAERSLVEVGGRWTRAEGASAVPAQLSAIVDQRLGDLGDDERRAIELIALAEPVPLDVAEDLIALDVLDTLDHRGLLKITTDERRLTLALTHPLYGESLRRRDLTVRRRTDLARLIGSVERRGARRRDDSVRMASWQLARGGRADPAVLARAAVAAQLGFDDVRCIELAGAGLAQDVPPDLRAELHLCRGVSRCRLGRFDEAEVDLATAAELSSLESFSGRPAEADRFARAVAAQAAVAADIRGDLETGLALLAGGLERLGTTSETAGPEVDLRLARAVLLADCGMAARCRAELDHLDTATLRPVQVVVRSLARAAERLSAGRPAEAIAAADDGLHEHLSHIEEVTTYHPASHFLPRLSALMDQGRLDAAERDARWLLRQGEREQRTTGTVVVLAVLASVSVRRGRPVSALAELGRADDLLTERSQLYVRRALRGIEAQCRAALGDVAGAQRAVDAMASLPSQSTDFLLMEEVRGRAATMVLAGRRADALQLLRGVADAAARNTSVRIEVAALDEVARLAPEPTTAALLAERTAGIDGRLAPLLVAEAQVRAEPAASEDAAAKLVNVAEGFARLGLLLRAAEDCSEASDRWRSLGAGRAATSAARRAAELLESCEGSRTVATVGTGSAVPLTAREREIALLVVRGATSREVAEQLFLSRRTVDNHLQRIYAKLGISGRQGLAQHLD